MSWFTPLLSVILLLISSGATRAALQPELVIQKGGFSHQKVLTSPNGSYQVSVDDFLIIVWDLQSGKELYQIRDLLCHQNVRISPNSQLLIAKCMNHESGYPNGIYFWELGTGKAWKKLPFLASSTNSGIDITPDGQHLVYHETQSQRLKRLNLSTQQIQTLPTPVNYGHSVDLHFIQGQNILARPDLSASHNKINHLTVHDAQTGKIIKTLTPQNLGNEKSATKNFELTPLLDAQNQIMVLSPHDDEHPIEVWSLKTLTRTQTLHLKPQGSQAQAISANGEWLALRTREQIKIYSLSQQRYIFSQNSSDSIKGFSHNQRHLITSSGKRLHFWDIAQQKITRTLHSEHVWNSATFLNPTAQTLLQQPNPDIARLMGGSYQQPALQLWDLQLGRRQGMITQGAINGNPIQSLTQSQDGKTLAVLEACAPHQIDQSQCLAHIYRLPHMTRLMSFKLGPFPDLGFTSQHWLYLPWQLSKDGQRLYALLQPQQEQNARQTNQGIRQFLRKYDLRSGQYQDLLVFHQAIERMVISPSEKELITRSKNGLQLWSLGQRKPLQSFAWKESPEYIPNQHFSMDGKFYSDQVPGGKTIIWRMPEFKAVASLHGPTLQSSQFTPHLYKSAFSADGKLYAGIYQEYQGPGDTAGSTLGIRVWSTSTWKLLHEKKITSRESMNGPSIHFKNTQEIQIALASGQMFQWNFQRQTLQHFYFSGTEKGWVAVTEEGYYQASRTGLDEIAFRVGHRAYPFEQFDLRYNRPDQIIARLTPGSPLIKAYQGLRQQRLKRMGFDEKMLANDFHMPVVKLLNPPDSVATSHNQLRLHIHAQDTKYKLNRIMVYVNDVPIHGQRGRDVRSHQTHALKLEESITLTPGPNKIQISALNQAGTESLRETVQINYAGATPRPTLHLITIGVSKYQHPQYNLEYAAKDAEDMASRLASRHKNSHQISQYLWRNQEVTRSQILALKSHLQRSRPEDRVIMFLSGHGLLNSDLRYYFAPYGMNFVHPAQHGITFDEIENLLDGIPAREKLLLIDTCNSGEMAPQTLTQTIQRPEGIVKARAVRGVKVVPGLGLTNLQALLEDNFVDLRRGSGATVMTSASGLEFAFESPRWQNGVFTYAFLEGLENKNTDINRDGHIQLSELQQHVAQRVRELTGATQTPTARRWNLSNDFAL